MAQGDTRRRIGRGEAVIIGLIGDSTGRGFYARHSADISVGGYMTRDPDVAYSDFEPLGGDDPPLRRYRSASQQFREYLNALNPESCFYNYSRGSTGTWTHFVAGTDYPHGLGWGYNLTIPERAIPDRCECVIIALGINDATHPSAPPRITAAEFIANMQRAIDQLQAAGIEVVLATENALTTSAEPSHDPALLDAYQEQFIPSVRLLAEANGCDLIDEHEASVACMAVEGPESTLHDGLHPNQRGQDLKARLLEAWAQDVVHVEDGSCQERRRERRRDARDALVVQMTSSVPDELAVALHELNDDESLGGGATAYLGAVALVDAWSRERLQVSGIPRRAIVRRCVAAARRVLLTAIKSALGYLAATLSSARSPQPSPTEVPQPWRLGEVLVDCGAISPKQLDSALGLQLLEHKRLGDLLVDQELLTENQLSEALRAQARLRAAA